MAARTIGRTLLVAATLALAAGASPALSGAGTPLAGIAWTPDAIVTAQAGGPSILCWLTAAWRAVAPDNGSSGQSVEKMISAPSTASATETPPSPPVQTAPLSYGGGRGDDPAGPWPSR